jgi:hypothetical protein
MTLEIVLVRVDGADIVLVMVTVANTFPVMLSLENDADGEVPPRHRK